MRYVALLPMPRITSFDQLVEYMRSKPTHLLGEPSVFLLRAFMSGFWYSEHCHELTENEQFLHFDFARFQRWLTPRFNPDGHMIDTFEMALTEAGSEADAFYLWFKWLDEYRKEQRDAT